MKRILILVAVVLLVAGSLFAEEATLIDFSLLKADIIPSTNDANKMTHNRRTMMDFSQVAGGSFTTEQKSVMRTSLAIEQWEVLLNSSAKTVGNMVKSYTREAPSKKYGTVMGVRVLFPTEPHNAWALVKPPFDIPAFEPNAEISDDGSRVI